MDSSSLELSLSLQPYSYVPKSIPNLLNHLSEIKDASERLSVLNHHLHQLEEELSRVEAFKGQFPHCMLFLTDGIKTLKKEALNIENGLGSESIRPIVDDSLSLKRTYEDEQRELIDGKRCRKEKNDKMSSCSGSCSQLCKLGHYKMSKIGQNSTQVNSFRPCKFRSGGGAAIAESSSMVVGNEHGKEVARVSGHGGLNLRANDQPINFQSEPLAQPIWKNNRRSWTQELHARFLEALEYLGGPNVATPKQIREIMQVEGLTNDQVKSHLQKYRLHGRRYSEDSEDSAEGSQDLQ